MSLSGGFTNYVRAGQFHYGKYPTVERKKAAGGSGSTFEIPIGLVLAKDPGLTTTELVGIAKANAKRPFFVSLGDEFKTNSGIAYPIGTNNLTDLAKKDTQTSVKVLSKGYVAILVDGVCLPDDPLVVTDGTGGTILGHLKAGTLADGDKIFGRFISLPGNDGAHNVRASTSAIGQVAWASFPW